MFRGLLISCFLLLCFLNGGYGDLRHPVPAANFNYEENRVNEFIIASEKELSEASTRLAFTSWAYESNITDYNLKMKIKEQKLFKKLSLRIGNEGMKYNLSQVYDINLYRKMKKILSNIGTSILHEEKLNRYITLTSGMSEIYSKAKVRDYNNPEKLLSLEPEISKIMANSRDPKELEYYWAAWRDQTGSKMRDMYLEYIELINEAARLNGFQDATEMSIQPYESDDFQTEMELTWKKLKPLYEEFHAYVRHRLWKIYGSEQIDLKGPIPSHLLGNMWAQSWSKIADILKPYPDKPSIDVTDEMKRQKWTPKIMFQKAEEFFTSIGLLPMPKKFWKGSIIEKPSDGRDLTCHASAWDFSNGQDFRIKQCTVVNQEQFVVVNHEMGHTEYQMLYANKSFLYREGANPGFHEGVGDTIALAVGTAGYFQKLGLLDNDVDVEDNETDINILFDMALQRLAFMPFGYLVDKYRWDLYSGWANPSSSLNCHWHRLRADIQGVMPPTKRRNDLFDAGAKYHVAANVGYVRYFTAYVYQFQFYKALCKESGNYDVKHGKLLHRCNFYGSYEAGTKLKSMLKLGSSKPWKEAMEVITGQPHMDTSAFREYFAPLEKWLKEQNRINGLHIGWNLSNNGLKDICEKSVSESGGCAIHIFSCFQIKCLFSIVIIIITFY